MIVIDKDNKNLVIPNGLGNINRDYQEGYEAGYQESFEEGKAEGLAEGKAEGLAEGKAIGIEEGKQIQKDLLEAITITENGTYNKEDGYNQVVVDVPDLNGSYDEGYQAGKTDGYDEGYDAGKTDGYDSGYTAGEVEQKTKLTNITISENGIYSREDGYNQVVVDVPDLNGDYQTGYDEGYDAGDIDGYNRGYDEGETSQKSKLTGITITENGIYSREDGYNEVIVDIEQEGGDLNPDTLREITITENGIYTSKYSELIKTGEFVDGTPFYGFGKVDGAVYDTLINLIEVGELESLEFWYKGDNKDVGNGWNVILSSNSIDRADEGSVEFRYDMDDFINVRIGGIERYFNLEEGVWHHFKLDNMCTLFVDDEEIFTFPRPLPTFTNFYINGTAYDEENNYSRNANGYFGLIRINEEVIIPTEDGFMNYNTGNILPTLKEGSYSYGNYDDGGEPYKTINVNVNIPLQEKYEWRNDTAEIFTILPDEGFDGMSKVEVDIYEPLQIKFNEGYERGIAEGGGGGVPSKIDVAEYGIKLSRSTFTDIPDFYDFSNVTDMSYMFSYCDGLQTIGKIDTSRATNMNSMFINCSNLQAIIEIDTSNVTDMSFMFQYCPNLQTLPALNVENLTAIDSYFGLTTMSKLTDVGGWIGLHINWSNNYGLAKCPKLSYRSCINILNGLADVPEGASRTLKVHQNFIDTVGEEISIGINKNWNIIA